GPALGGVRWGRYDVTGALREARGLAKGMTHKNTFAELPYGGAKSVIFAPDLITTHGPITTRDDVMRAFRRFVARTNGAYIPSVDMGTTLADMQIVGAGGVPVSCSRIDPSPWTALGVRAAIAAAVEADERIGSLAETTILIQGAGRVG